RLYSPVRDERVLPEEPTQKPKAPSPSLPQASASPPSRVSPPFDRLPPDAQSMLKWAQAKGPVEGGAVDYGRLDTIRRTQPYPLGDIPLIVLTRGKTEYPPIPGVSVQELDEDRKRLQVELVRLSRNSRQVLVEDSGHHIHVEQPAAVIAAIREVVEA